MTKLNHNTAVLWIIIEAMDHVYEQVDKYRIRYGLKPSEMESFLRYADLDVERWREWWDESGEEYE